MLIDRLCFPGYENNEYLLAKDLFVNYSREARPVRNTQGSVQVDADFFLGRIGNLVQVYFALIMPHSTLFYIS